MRWHIELSFIKYIFGPTILYVEVCYNKKAGRFTVRSVEQPWLGSASGLCVSSLRKGKGGGVFF